MKLELTKEERKFLEILLRINLNATLKIKVYASIRKHMGYNFKSIEYDLWQKLEYD